MAIGAEIPFPVARCISRSNGKVQRRHTQGKKIDYLWQSTFHDVIVTRTEGGAGKHVTGRGGFQTEDFFSPLHHGQLLADEGFKPRHLQTIP